MATRRSWVVMVVVAAWMACERGAPQPQVADPGLETLDTDDRGTVRELDTETGALKP